MASPSHPSKRKIVVFSGGTAANSLVDVFNEVLERNECTLSYVIPISDNGGSSSELIRVFGGPGIGDVRSMIFPLTPHTPPSYAFRLLRILSHPPSFDLLDLLVLGKLLLLLLAQDKVFKFLLLLGCLKFLSISYCCFTL